MVSGGDKASAPIVREFERVELERGKAVLASHASSPAQTLVGCGRVRDDLRVVIAHPDTDVQCEVGAVGEVWVSGGSVAQGYWNRPGETERTFAAYLKDTAEGPFVRTGDLGFLDDGELFIRVAKDSLYGAQPLSSGHREDRRRATSAAADGEPHSR
jgi:acyl-CoA synthetase (AMP-forming)/AMP-acid ligase II